MIFGFYAAFGERPYFRLEGRCSVQLSYWRICEILICTARHSSQRPSILIKAAGNLRLYFRKRAVIIKHNQSKFLQSSFILLNQLIFVNGGTIAMKKISILGDSISTFSGYTTPDGVFYDLFSIGMADMRSVEDTWWMQVIRGLGGQLEVNNSFSSTTVSDADDYLPPLIAAGYVPDRFHSSPNYLSGCSDQRTAGLGNPDMILIFMGTNDAGYRIDPARFEQDYRRMLRKIKANYPAAQIWCGTLLWSHCVKDERINYYQTELGGAESLIPYNCAIRTAVAAEHCLLADLAASGQEYAAIDCAHPHASGMKTIASLWLQALTGSHTRAQ